MEKTKKQKMKKVPSRVFPQVQVPFSDLSKVPKKFGPKARVLKLRRKFQRKIPEIVWKKCFALFPNYFSERSPELSVELSNFSVRSELYGTLEKSGNGT